MPRTGWRLWRATRVAHRHRCHGVMHAEWRALWGESAIGDWMMEKGRGSLTGHDARGNTTRCHRVCCLVYCVSRLSSRNRFYFLSLPAQHDSRLPRLVSCIVLPDCCQETSFNIVAAPVSCATRTLCLPSPWHYTSPWQYDQSLGPSL